MEQLMTSMIESLRGQYLSLEPKVGPAETATVRGIMDEMSALAKASNGDYGAFMTKLTASGLMNKYNAEITRLCALVNQ
jgi:hypothetical protein